MGGPGARRRRRVSPAGGSRSGRGRRRRPRCGASGWRRRPTPRGCLRTEGTAGTLRPDLSPGGSQGGGRMPRAPASSLGPTAPSSLMPPPPPPPRATRRRHPFPASPTPRQRLPGPSLRQPRGLHPPSPHLHLGPARPRPGLREPEEPEDCMAGGRRSGAARHPPPAAPRLGPRGLAAFRRAGGRGSGEEAAGVCTCRRAAPQSAPLMKARRPAVRPPARAAPPPAPGPCCPWVEALWARLVPRPGPGLAWDRGREPLGKI